MQVFRTIGLSLALLLSAGIFGAPAQSDAGQRDKSTETFVRGFVRFLASHEAGHLLMGQIANLNSHPDWSAADREDYADRFATILLQPDPGDPDGLGVGQQPVDDELAVAHVVLLDLRALADAAQLNQRIARIRLVFRQHDLVV